MGPKQLLPLSQLRRPLETLQLPRCYLSSAGSILRRSQTIAITWKRSSRTLKPLGSFTPTNATPGPSVPTLGQETETLDTETQGNHKRGSFHYDQVNGILPLEWPNLAAFETWHWNEELAHSIKLIKSMIVYSGQVWTLRHIFMCSHEDGGGGTKYVKKHLEQKRKIPSRKMDCLCNIMIKCYPGTERILGHYEMEHNHPIGIANVLFMHLSARSRK